VKSIPPGTSTTLLQPFSLAEAAAYSPQVTLQVSFPAQCGREKSSVVDFHLLLVQVYLSAGIAPRSQRLLQLQDQWRRYCPYENLPPLLVKFDGNWTPSSFSIWQFGTGNYSSSVNTQPAPICLITGSYLTHTFGSWGRCAGSLNLLGCTTISILLSLVCPLAWPGQPFCPTPFYKTHSNLVYFDRSALFSPSALLVGREASPSTRTSTSHHARGHSWNLAWHLLGTYQPLCPWKDPAPSVSYSSHMEISS